MDKVYRRYADSRGHNSLSAIGRYIRAKEQSDIDNYIQHKKRMSELYLLGQAEKEQIERIAKEIVKAVDEVIGGKC